MACCNAMQGSESGLASVQGLASGNAMAAELERVLYVQMLVLFAPQAVPAAAHLPLLLITLQAPQPFLRQAAAATLRHLAGEKLCFYLHSCRASIQPRQPPCLAIARP